MSRTYRIHRFEGNTMIKLYHAPRTRSLRIVWLLEELGLPYTVERVEFAPQPDRLFAQNTPNGKVPVLEDGEVVMFESGAMVEYLLERYGKGRLAPAIGSSERATFLQWLHFSESTAFAPLASVVWLVRYRTDAAQNGALIADAKGRATMAFAFLEKALGTREYLLESGFSAADIMMGFTLFAARAFGVIDDSCPRLTAYSQRIEARPAYQKAVTV